MVPEDIKPSAADRFLVGAEPNFLYSQRGHGWRIELCVTLVVELPVSELGPTMRTIHEKQVAQEAVTGVDGVTQVVNEIQVE